MRKSVASLRLALWADSSQVPPPTLPTDGDGSPAHCGSGAAAIWPAGVLNDSWNTEPPNQDGPGIMRTLSAEFLAKSELNTLLVDIVWFLTSVSSRAAIRVQSGLVVFTLTDFGPVISLAPHLAAQR